MGRPVARLLERGTQRSVSRGGTAGPLLLRVAVGDIVAARASLLVVSHLNGLRPSGAEAAVDAALDGALSRRAATGAFDGPFGWSQFVPSVDAPMAAHAVLVLSLGEPGRLNLIPRLPELGVAIADAAAAIRAREIATVVHGTGPLGVPIGRAARLIVQGLVSALAQEDGPTDLRELQLVTRDPERAHTIRRNLARLEIPDRADVQLTRGVLTLPDRRAEPGSDARAAARRLHLGITRVRDNLKVTLITEDAFNAADNAPYPTAAVVHMLRDTQGRVVTGARRGLTSAMQAIGTALFDAFLSWPRFGVAEALRQQRGGDVLLRLDESTVDLPWELAFTGGRFLSRGWVLARQREINAPGHPAAYVAPHDCLRALVVVGDPDGNLPGAREEAQFVADTLKGLGAEVRGPAGILRRADVLAAIDDFNPDVLHYAGHARFDPLRQQAGGLVLADGCLTADDVAKQARLPRLFFANGCNAAQTGDLAEQQLSDGTVPTSDFAGRVLRGGARAMVGSQWPVEDSAARTFAEHFYRALVEGDSTTIGDAVLAARNATAARHRTEPAWAAYALYGTPWKPAL